MCDIARMSQDDFLKYVSQQVQRYRKEYSLSEGKFYFAAVQQLRSAVAHSKIVLQMPESLECCAVPFRQAGLGFIGCLEEIEENIVR